MADKQYTKEKCENCGYKYNCYGTFGGGHCICNRCYSLWFENIKLKEENEKLKEYKFYDTELLPNANINCENCKILECKLYMKKSSSSNCDKAVIRKLKEENKTLKEMVNKIKNLGY